MYSTPSTTIGMGEVDPCNTDPVPTKRICKKRKMKALKDYIKKKQKTISIEESLDRTDWESRVWETNEVCDFFTVLDIDDKDIDLFNESHKEEITEYATTTDVTEEFILGQIPTMKEVSEFEPTLLYKMLQITKGEANCYWFDNGSGLDTICIEVQDFNRDKTYIYIFGADTYKLDKIISEIEDVNSGSFKTTDCLQELFDFSE
jgi:hypothetical protein